MSAASRQKAREAATFRRALEWDREHGPGAVLIDVRVAGQRFMCEYADREVFGYVNRRGVHIDGVAMDPIGLDTLAEDLGIEETGRGSILIGDLQRYMRAVLG